MHLTIEQERMSDFFLKHHVAGLPRSAVFHELGVDHGPHHDHPWPFTSFVVHGRYVEEVLDPATGDTQLVEHNEGDSFRIEAGHVHRVIEVAPDTVTLILPGHPERKSGFYRREGDVTLHRFHDQPDFTPIKTAGQDESRAVA